MSSPFKPQAPKKNRKGAALTDAIEQAAKLQHGKKLPVGKRISSGQMSVRLLMPATKKQQQEIHNLVEQEWKAIEPQWRAAESRILDKVNVILGKEVKRI